MKRIVSFVVLIAIVGFFAFLSFEVLSGFLLPLFLAVLLTVMFRPMHNWVSRRLRGRERLAAGLTTLFVLLIFLMPLLWFVSRAATDTLALVSEFDQQSVTRQMTRLRERYDLESPPVGVDEALIKMEATLNRLRDASLPAAAFEKEHDLRKEELGRLETSDLKQLVDALWPTSVAPSHDEAAKERDRMLGERIDEFQSSTTKMTEVIDDRTRLAAAVKVSQQSLDNLREAIFGGPLKLWARRLLKFDDAQLAQFHEEAQAIARPLALGTTQFVGSFVMHLLMVLAVMSVSLYYFLADGPLMLEQLMKVTPLDSRYEVQLLDQFGQLTRAILVAMLLSAAVQGVLAGVGYALAGFDSIFLLSVLTMVFAIVPFIGAIPIWGSCALWLFLHDGRPQAAIALAAYGTILGFVGDNLIKPWVLHGRSNLHPLLGLLSVLGGVQALGPIGIVVGPMAVAILQTLLVMLRTELAAMDDATPATIKTSLLEAKPPPAKADESLIST